MHTSVIIKCSLAEMTRTLIVFHFMVAYNSLQLLENVLVYFTIFILELQMTF